MSYLFQLHLGLVIHYSSVSNVINICLSAFLIKSINYTRSRSSYPTLLIQRSESSPCLTNFYDYKSLYYFIDY